ncbi:hypothetical protein OPT61_g10023 [Boeremia exigua]|uniref:Uncharacterized protein n=1 Tax=Boeremia exigua TaxID=749465 RepID=A0ACC2HRT3_9PLEO|nr:hypothetical protein OPT61_g10023 [Boeremia exigua]
MEIFGRQDYASTGLMYTIVYEQQKRISVEIGARLETMRGVRNEFVAVWSPLSEALDKFKIKLMLACHDIDPTCLGFLPPAVRQVCFQHVVFVTLVGELKARRAVFGQEGICASGDVVFRHVHVGALVAAVPRVPLDGAYRAVQMHLQDTGVPQRVVDSLADKTGIAGHKLAVPRNRLAARQVRYGHAVVQYR